MGWDEWVRIKCFQHFYCVKSDDRQHLRRLLDAAAAAPAGTRAQARAGLFGRDRPWKGVLFVPRSRTPPRRRCIHKNVFYGASGTCR